MEFKIPPLPTTLGEILQVLSREVPVPDNNRLVEIIEKDPALSVYVLRQVNSVYYGLRCRVTEIRRAVALLGLKRVCNLALSASLKQSFVYLEDAASRTIYEHVIKTSVATAAFARDLAAYLNLPLAETAFTAGLLHQLGRLVFLYSAPQRYVSLWYTQAHTVPEAPSREAEAHLFNTDYLQLGATTLRQWNLPAELVLITNCLDTPDEIERGPLRTLALTVAVGNTASASLFLPVSPETDEAIPNAPSCLKALAEKHDRDIEDLARFLDERRDAVSQFARSVMGDC